MNYIVLDLEWNQPFNMRFMVREPVMLHGEIIQIGAVKLDENYHLIDTFKIMVAPKYYRTMHKKVTKLTNVTTADLQYGFPFKTAFRHFSNWCGNNFAFLTWGPDDIEMLLANMRIHKLTTEWIPNAYNLQIIFDNQLTKTNHQVSLKNAMAHVGEAPLEAHDALNDARNTARLCSHMDLNKGVNEYATLKEQFNMDVTNIVDRCRHGNTFHTREEAFNDTSLLSFYCPSCGMQAKCVDPIRQNYDKYICLAQCKNGEEFFVRFKFTKGTDGTISVVRFIYEMDEQNANYYYIKKQEKETRKRAYLERIDIAYGTENIG